MWQLITNRKSIATKVDELEWPWTSIYCSVGSFMHVVAKSLSLESRDVDYKVALYVSYLQTNFEYEIKENPFEFLA